MLRLVFVFIFVFLTSFAFAQQHTLEGVVYELKTHVALADINIENLNGKFKTQTDKEGHFVIEAKAGDLLAFSGSRYKADTVLLTNLLGREFYLAPVQHMLKEVVVNAQGAAAVNQSAFKQQIDPNFHNQTMAYQRNVDGPNADGSIKGGVSLRIWSNKKTENDAKKREQQAQREKIITQIQQAFSDENVEKYVPLRGQELHSFALRYSPDIKTFTSEDFNLAKYISNCYKEFLKLTPEERLKTPIFGD
ncbi:hypothetical protein [Mucilaginibacter aquaedulcis]|uniref:hypothetical protein n=1 Tax=Mucilaginibacter aquaedulcis TaxID=1187081 RepID=UPI0025B3D0C9|nr:hypothetical protein [Mucilaginibacter aquaedulcis]MDN3550126.1 hypothetical protein [Mucilaginibacter aquaedulcis]